MAKIFPAAESQAENLPSDYADNLGGDFVVKMDSEKQKSQGVYLTPLLVARYMASWSKAKQKTLRVLEPAAGAGVLICALVEELVSRNKKPEKIEIDAYEIDPELSGHLKLVLKKLTNWAGDKGVQVIAKVHNQDFILKCGNALNCFAGSLPLFQTVGEYDVVIGNPPYFKLSKSDPRAQIAACVVHGQPNIYGLFMALSAALLKPEGEFIFITPRSFSSGPYFRLFREKFFGAILPTDAHVFGSRRDAFKRDEVLQENVILRGTRTDQWEHQKTTSRTISLHSSRGVSDIGSSAQRKLPIESVLDSTSKGRIFRLPVTDLDLQVLEIVDSWRDNLRTYGLEISTGPVVPFRATEFICHEGKAKDSFAPLLWMHHVKAMDAHWPNGTRKQQYINLRAKDEKLLVRNANYVLMRRFSAKEEVRRLVAAPYVASKLKAEYLGLENHLNYVHRPGGAIGEDEAFGLAAFYNSRLMNDYFRISNGNTQVSATELRAMPLPPISLIKELGKRIQETDDQLGSLDNLLVTLLSPQQTEFRGEQRLG